MDAIVKYSKTERLHQMCKKWIGIFLLAMLGLTVISRFLDSVIVPVVTVTIPKKSVLQYQVKGSAFLEAEELLTVAVLPDINVRRVIAGQGQTVTADTPLFAYQLDELEKLCRTKEQELQQLKLTLESEALSSQPLPEMTEEELALQELAVAERKLNRAGEKLGKAEIDYRVRSAALLKEHAENLEKNREDLLKERENAYIEAEQAYEIALLDRRSENKTASWEYNEALQKLEQLEEEGASEDEIDLAQEALYRADQKRDVLSEKWQLTVDLAEKVKEDAYDDWHALINGQENIDAALRKEYEENLDQEESRLQAVRDEQILCADDYQDARIALENARKNDSYAQQGVNRELELSGLKQQSAKIDIAEKEAELEEIKQLIAQEGVVYAPYTGVLANIDLTADTSCVRIGSGGLLMKTDIDEEEARVLTTSSTVILQKEGHNLEASTIIKSLAPDQEKEQVRLTAIIENTTLIPGTEVDFICESKSPVYNVTIPIDALRQDSTGTYVLEVQKRNSVLGTELTAVRQNVTVLAKSTESAAVEGALTPESQVIAGSSRSIEDGARVRMVSD